MNSDTSSDLNINFMDNNKNIKKDTSDTDYYLNLLANPHKTKEEDIQSSSLEISNSEKEEDKRNSSSSSRPVFDDIKLNNVTKSPNSSENKLNFSDTRSDRRSDHRSDRRSDYSNHSEKLERHSDSKYDRSDDNMDIFENIDTDYDRKAKKKKKHKKKKSYNVDTDINNLTPEQLRMKKIEMLRKLSELKLKGYKLSKEYDFNSSLEEMNYEYDLLRSFADKRNGIKLYKNLILNACSVIEFANDKYDPFKFKLSGWSEHMNLEVDNYDDVLEELYEKYRGSGGTMPPELKLLLLILASASAFHFSKRFESKVPGLNNMYKKNSGFVSGMFKNNKKQQFMSPQEINIQQQREEMMQQEKERKRNIMNNQPQREMHENSVNNTPMFANSNNQNFQNSFQSVQNQNPVISKSDNVDEILKKLHDNDGTDEESSINNDRIISDTTISEGGTRRKKKKPMMIIA